MAEPSRGAWFAVDDEARIVDYDDGLKALLGASGDELLGHRCFEVVRGVDGAGRAVCGRSCPALRALQRGARSGSAKLRRPHAAREGSPAGGSSEAYHCHLTALPSGTGGAVATLTPAEREAPSADRSTVPAGASSPSDGAPAPLPDRLAGLVSLTDVLAGGATQANLRRALDVVRDATGADVAELFLATPGAAGLVLTVHRGTFQRAFLQRLRFEPHVGLPGLVLAHGVPVTSEDLGRDERYLRERVKEAGFRAYACVPVDHGGQLVGALAVALRNGGGPAARALPFLQWAVRPLGAAVQASLAVHRTSLQAALQGGGASCSEPRATFRRALEELVRRSGAASGELRLLSPQGGASDARPVAQVGEARPARCAPLEGGAPEACPVLSGEQGVTLYGRPASWPAACRSRGGCRGVRSCIPLQVEGTTIGLLRTWHDADGGDPPSKDLALLEGMAESVAWAVQSQRGAWDAERRGRDVYRVLLDAETQPRPSDPGPADASTAEALASAPHVDVRCFGSFALEIEGALVDPRTVRRRKTLTLLKILVARRGRPVARDALIESLWPGGDPRTKADQLYVLVHELRRLLGRDAEGTPHVGRDGDRYFLDPAASIRVDLWEFETLARAAAEADAGGKPRAALSAGEQAAALYGGDLLEDEPYAEWCLQEREGLRESLLDLLLRMAACATTIGDADRSIAYMRRALRLDPLREATHRTLMETLRAAGRWDEAIQQYRVCEEHLRRELGVPPLPETAQLLDTIRRERSARA